MNRTFRKSLHEAYSVDKQVSDLRKRRQGIISSKEEDPKEVKKYRSDYQSLKDVVGHLLTTLELKESKTVPCSPMKRRVSIRLTEAVLDTPYGDFPINTEDTNGLAEGPVLYMHPLYLKNFVGDYEVGYFSELVRSQLQLDRFPTLKALNDLNNLLDEYKSSERYADQRAVNNEKFLADFLRERGDQIDPICDSIGITSSDLRWSSSHGITLVEYPEYFLYIPVLSSESRRILLINSEAQLEDWYGSLPTSTEGIAKSLLSLIGHDMVDVIDRDGKQFCVVSSEHGQTLAARLVVPTRNPRYVNIGGLWTE